MEPSWFIWLLVLMVGLCVGSFLNVVITRLPVMLMQQWRQEARTCGKPCGCGGG